jgi:hypothetical protein
MLEKLTSWIMQPRHYTVDSEELSMLELVGRTANKTNEIIEEMGNKTDLTGDHKGSWHGIKKPVFAEPGIAGVVDHLDKKIGSIVQVNLLEYSEYANGNDWTDAMETLLAENPIGEIYIPSGTYEFTRTINLGENNSLLIDIGCTIKAISFMEVFIRRHAPYSNLTRAYNFYNRIHGKGVIDCNGLANVGISLGGYRGYDIDDITILDMVQIGVLTKGTGVTYAVELSMSNVNIEVRNDSTSLIPTGIKVNSSDNHFDNIIIVDCKKGIECTDFSNRFFRVHHWMRDRIINADIGAISFDDTGAWNTYDTCYADTSNVGFSTGGGNTFVNCEYFNSQYFNADNVTGFKMWKDATSTVIFENCRVRGDGSTNVLNAFTGTVNDFVRFVNCYNNHLVTNGFPPYSKNYDNIYKYLKSDGDIDCLVLRATNKVQSLWYNFDTSKAMTCNSDNMVTLNGRVMPQFVTAPTTTGASGANGQIAYDNNYIYVYVNGQGWRRSALTTW